MRLLLKKCHTCGRLGVGPNKIKLWPFEGRLFCQEDYKDALTWDESRSSVIHGITNLKDFEKAAVRLRRYGLGGPKIIVSDWRGYIQELSEMAAWALQVGDKKTFVHYFSRATHAWALKEGS